MIAVVLSKGQISPWSEGDRPNLSLDVGGHCAKYPAICFFPAPKPLNNQHVNFQKDGLNLNF